MLHWIRLGTAVVTLTGAWAAHAETPPANPFAAAVDAEVSKLEKTLTAEAEAMPPEKFDARPESSRVPGSAFDGVRTFGEQVRHVAADNFAIWAPLTGKPEPAGIDAPNGPPFMKSRAEILRFLAASFAYAHEAAAKLTSDNALGLVEFRGSKVTRLSLVTLALTHASEHYGQLVVYLRWAGIVPPASRPR
jgi:hypothetical protein